jgi:hypothetical protein
VTRRSTHRELVFAAGASGVTLVSHDPAALRWLTEFLGPWFASGTETSDRRVRLSSDGDTYNSLRARFPSTAESRVCFAFDSFQLALPSESMGASVMVDDSERSCFLRVSPSEVDLVGDPRSRRWRFTAALVMLEIVATRMRRTALDLHSAAVEAAGRAVLLVGPKKAGKTTLSIYLLRSGYCRAIANDRVFAVAEEEGFLVHGVPTAVKIRPETVEMFPELLRELPAVSRPYLYGLDELVREQGGPPRGGVRSDRSDDLALSPPQFLRQMAVEARASAPLGAILFPQVRPDVDRSTITPIGRDEAADEIWSNLYGPPVGCRETTLFEELDGGVRHPLRRQVDDFVRSAPAYRVLLGPNAYVTSELAERVLETVVR